MFNVAGGKGHRERDELLQLMKKDMSCREREEEERRPPDGRERTEKKAHLSSLQMS